MEEKKPNRKAFDAIQIGEFRLYIIMRFFFIMALRMIGTVVGWKIYMLTRNPLALGMIGLSEVIPAVSLALYAGHVIDKNDKRKMLLKTICFYLLCAIALLIIHLDASEQYAGKKIIEISIYLVIFCTGIIRAFSGPISNSIIAQIVPRNILPNAITWSSGTWLIASVTGHATAGFLIAHAGYTITFSVIIGYIIIAIVCIAFIGPKPIANLNQQKTWESMKEGLRHVFKTKELLGALSLDLFAVLFGGAVALIPVFAADILKVGAEGFGWLNAAADIGAITSIALLTFFPLQKNQGRILLYAVAGFGICIILFGLSTLFWLSFAALVLSGILDGISVVVRSTILQLKTPDSMRGRVSSINSMFINSSNELGQFESGVAAKLVGVVPAVVLGGCMTLFVVVVTWLKAPSLRRLEY
ncbi:MAG: MFS transporter [Chitinophagaceae bacterium]|nr:MFS transporter [Chitinophagaceae bacterium]